MSLARDLRKVPRSPAGPMALDPPLEVNFDDIPDLDWEINSDTPELFTWSPDNDLVDE
jgi:hypothetical protein